MPVRLRVTTMSFTGIAIFETGQTKALPFHWDRYLFRLVCFLGTSIIHESVKPKIFDMDKIRRLSGNTKSEALAYRLNMEEDRVPSEIAPDVIPTTQSYRDAASPPPPKRRRPANPAIAQQGENDGARLDSGSGGVRGERFC